MPFLQANLTPSIYVPIIYDCKKLCKEDLKLKVVYNSYYLNIIKKVKDNLSDQTSHCQMMILISKSFIAIWNGKFIVSL